MSSSKSLLRCFILIFFFLLIPVSWQSEADAGQLQLAWTDNAADEDGFQIERKTGTTGSYTQIATVGPNVTSYSDFSLADGATYCYRVRAFNSVGNSAYTLEECAAARSMQISSIGVFRSSIGEWYLDNGNGTWDGCGVDGCYAFGMSGGYAGTGGLRWGWEDGYSGVPEWDLVCFAFLRRCADSGWLGNSGGYTAKLVLFPSLRDLTSCHECDSLTMREFFKFPSQELPLS